MSAICFRTTPDGYLTNYSFIFRNPELSGTEIKNIIFSRLGTMLYLEIQKGKEDMKTEKFQHQIGGTAACTERLMMDTKG